MDTRTRGEDWAAYADALELNLEVAALWREVREERLALAQRRIAALEHELKYRPDQPRVPAGYREGGQWTVDGAGTPSAHPRRIGASRLVEGPPQRKDPGTPWDEGKRPIDLGALFGIGTADAQQPSNRPEWAKNLSKDGLTYYGQKYVPNAQLPPEAHRVLGHAQRTPTPEGMKLSLPPEFKLVPAPRGGGFLMAPPEYKPGDEANIVRIQPFDTGSSVRHDYLNGYYVVYGANGVPISVYSGRELSRMSPGVHNPYGHSEPSLFSLFHWGKSLSIAGTFEREKEIVAQAVGLRAALSFTTFEFRIDLIAPRGTIRISIGAMPTIISDGARSIIPLEGRPPFSPLIAALDGKTITAARLSPEVMELEFGTTLVQIPHTPDLWSFVIGVNFGEGDPLSGTWFF